MLLIIFINSLLFSIIGVNVLHVSDTTILVKQDKIDIISFVSNFCNIFLSIKSLKTKL